LATLRRRCASATMMLASTAKASPPTTPSFYHGLEQLTQKISRADCAPVTLPPRPAAKHVNLSQSWFVEPPTKEPPPRVDLREAGEKSAGRNIAHGLKDLAFQLNRFQSADKLVERLSADEREEVRLGIEA
jgi:hypothetical protein